MRLSRKAGLVVAGACTLLAAWLWVARSRERAAGRLQHDGEHATECRCEAGASGTAAAPSTASAPVRPGHATATPQARTAARYAVCPREETRPALAQVALEHERPALWALHCGRSVHLIAFEAFDGMLVPRRLAVVQTASPSPSETAAAGEPSAADVNGDARADLIVPVTFVDATGVARGGGLYALQQRAEGGFDPPRRIVAAAPGSVALAQLDAEPAADVAIVNRADASTGRTDELWLVAGGPSPLRIAKMAALVGTSAVAALDLDGDQRDDLVATSASEGRVLIWLSGTGALAEASPVELRAPGVQQLLVADVDHDGGRELVLVGERSSLLHAPLAQAPVAVAIDDSEGLRDVHLADTDLDGTPELVGYVHPELIALQPVGNKPTKRIHLLSLRGEVSVLFARIAQLDADPRPDLVLAVVSPAEGNVEIGAIANLEPASVVQLAAESVPIADFVLIERFTLP